MWWEIIEGLLMLVFIHPWATLMFWEKTGFPFWFTFSILTIHGFFCLILLYFGTGRLNAVLTEKIRKPIDEITQIIFKNYKPKKTLVNWLLSKGKGITLILNFAPWVLLPTATIIAARLMKIHHAFPILFAGNIFRNLIFCLAVYVFHISIF